MVTPRWVRTSPVRPRMVHVNSTATGGGVAELLHRLVPALNASWAVIDGTAEFFAITKQLHNLLHDRADPAVLADPATRATYDEVLAPQAEWLAGQLDRGDVVVLHDPQTLGMAPELARHARVFWHCHIGTCTENAPGPAAVWRFFAEQLPAVDGVICTLPQFAPPDVRTFVVAPAIDPGAPKNRELTDGEISALLDEIGLTTQASSALAAVEQQAPIPPHVRTVLQVSRWDPLKDMPGVLRCLRHLPDDVHLVLAGTNPDDIPDDPEGFAVLAEVRAALSELDQRDRVHLVLTSTKDPERAALLINALQRKADVVLQKSIEEGFGLTVTEAMAKGKPVVAADVGGLRAQVVTGTGLLVDPTDPAAVAKALLALLDDPERRRELGVNAAAHVARGYTLDRLVADYRTLTDWR